MNFELGPASVKSRNLQQFCQQVLSKLFTMTKVLRPNVNQRLINNYAPSQDLVDNKDKDEPRFDLMPQESRKPTTPSPPASPASSHEALHKETNRLSTLLNYPVPYIDKKLLACIGFFYIGPNDLVKCYFCKVEIGMWEPDDNPVDEHLRWSPNCRLMRGRETNNEPIDAEILKRILPQLSYDTCGILDVHPTAYVESGSQVSTSSQGQSQSPQPTLEPLSRQSAEAEPAMRRPEHPEFQIEADRFATYEDWPKTMKQKPKELAEAGFYYTGKGDRVICFSCGGGLKHWEENDVPWEQHAMWYNKCEYLKLMKGQPYIDGILARKNTPPCSFSEESPAPAPAVEQPSTTEAETGRPVNENRSCKICYEAEYNTAFIPCGHIIACAKCATSVSKCPYCRQPFTNVMRVYLS